MNIKCIAQMQLTQPGCVYKALAGTMNIKCIAQMQLDLRGHVVHCWRHNEHKVHRTDATAVHQHHGSQRSSRHNEHKVHRTDATGMLSPAAEITFGTMNIKCIAQMQLWGIATRSN